MTLTISLPPETEKKLLRRAAEQGQDAAEYIRTLVEKDLRKADGTPSAPQAEMTFDQILGPVREAWQESGLTDEQVDQLFDETLKQIRRAKRGGSAE